MKCITVGENDKGQRVDKFLQKSFNLPTSLMYKYFRKKRIKLNGKKCEGSTLLCLGDKLELYINDELIVGRERTVQNNSSLNIVYEDSNIIIMDKPQGLLCHGENGEDSLVGRMQAYLFNKGEYALNELSFAPALCNRLDRNTAGLLIGAKNAEALRLMNENIKNGKVSKFYLCLVLGKPKKDSAILESNLTKNEKTNKVALRDRADSGSRHIKTGYRVLKTNGKLSLLEVELFTGRPHQIRAQLAQIGNPLAGDNKYGNPLENKALKMEYQALYSYKIVFSPSLKGEIFENIKGKEFETESVYFRELL